MSSTSPEARLLAKVHPEPNTGCWLFGGAWDKDGYGMFHFRGKAIRAHQAAWAIFLGRLPRAREIDHTCRVRACCNPAHLEAVTRCTNMHRVYRRRKEASHG